MTDKTNGNDWMERDAPQEHVRQGTYPFVQWTNGQPALTQVHPVLGSGGWMLPVDQVGPLAKVKAVAVPHRGGSSTEAYLAGELGFAVLATRFAWFRRTGGQTVYLDSYEEGARGKLQVLALVKGVSESEPVMVTLSGYASKHFLDTLKAFRKEVLGAAKALTGRAYPDYAFWLRVRAGEAVEVGSGSATSTVTPPVPAWDAAALKDTQQRQAALSALAVPGEVWQAAQAHWDEAQTWAEVARRRGQGSAPPVEDEEYPYDDAPPYVGEDEIPF
jgi:hypothetical protein